MRFLNRFNQLFIHYGRSIRHAATSRYPFSIMSIQKSYTTTTTTTSSMTVYPLSSHHHPLGGGRSNNCMVYPKRIRRQLLSTSKIKRFIPRKAAIELTPKARKIFQQLLKNRSSSNNNGCGGIILKLQHSTSGQPRMVFTFGFIDQTDVSDTDEGVSLELLEDGVTPKSPKDSINDGLPKLFVHETSFMKVLGGKLDVEIANDGNLIPKIYDKEGNLMDPNA